MRIAFVGEPASADTKLIPSWFVRGRDSDAAMSFMDDLASRLASRVQLTSDGHKAYLEAVEGAFGGELTMRCWSNSIARDLAYLQPCKVLSVMSVAAFGQ